MAITETVNPGTSRNVIGQGDVIASPHVTPSCDISMHSAVVELRPHLCFDLVRSRLHRNNDQQQRPLK